MSKGPAFLDFFCGFGGSSSGLTEAGYELNTAYNHWDKAIAVHADNFRNADHVQGDLSGYDMRRLPKADVLWASPECTWHSPAGGRKRVRAEEATLFGEPGLPADAGVRSRATMWDPIRAAEARGFAVVMIENVPEVAAWPLFPVWLQAWEALGYDWQICNLNAAHAYDDDCAPAGQWRDRIYVVLTAKGVRKPRLEPSPLAWCPQCEQVVHTVQSWKRPPVDGVQVGKYRQQYVYVCGEHRHGRQVVEPYVLPAAVVIDWSDLGTRIGDRKRPLSAATMRRIEVGARMFARPDSEMPPWLVEYYGNGGALPVNTPTGAMTTHDRHALCVPPYAIAVNHDGDGRQRTLDAGPLPTRSTKIGDGLAFPPYVAELYGTSTARDAGAPLSAVTAGGNHHGVCVPPGAFLSRQYSQRGSDSHLATPVSEPTHAITATGGNHALVIPSRVKPAPYEGDLPYDIADTRFRMLGPREHLRAQRFWEDYDTHEANKTETTKGAGNAVAVNAAHWIGSRVMGALS